MVFALINYGGESLYWISCLCGRGLDFSLDFSCRKFLIYLIFRLPKKIKYKADNIATHIGILKMLVTASASCIAFQLFLT